MTELDLFEGRLASALRGYADDAAPIDDPYAFASTVAAQNPRTRQWLPTRPGLRILLVLLLLLTMTMLAFAAAAGVFGPRQLTIDPRYPVPAVALGRWTNDVAAEAGSDRVVFYPYSYIEFAAPSLISLRDGTSSAWAGRVTAYRQDEAASPAGSITITANGECGEARYLVNVLPDVPTEGNLALELVVAEDQCTARRTLLERGPWVRPAVPIRTGETYDSLGFTEPFHFTPPLGVEGGFDVGTARQDAELTRLEIVHPYWFGIFVDDELIHADLCEPSKGTLSDVPATVEAVDEWVRRSSLAAVPTPTELTVDGRRALRWTMEGACPGERGPVALSWRGEFATTDFGAKLLYAVATPDDVILWIVPQADTDADVAVIDALVESIVFD